jgi:hypothetical protein
MVIFECNGAVGLSRRRFGRGRASRTTFGDIDEEEKEARIGPACAAFHHIPTVRVFATKPFTR